MGVSTTQTESASLTSAPPALRVREPLTIVIFGASGDLTHRKLVPALYAMFVHGFLPAEFAVVGVARRDYDDARFRQMMADAVREFGRLPADQAKLDDFCGRLHYHRGDIEEAGAYEELRKKLFDRRRFPANHLFYLSIRPELFSTALEQMKGCGLLAGPGEDRWTRVVIEKPFGRDLASARQLNQEVLRQAHESQVYRIDHFLGKETVQNILSFRFANAIFEPLFNHHYVDHIQITASETVGMESGRGAYYDASGALRDMVQNHMLQLLCLVTMDPPASLTADAIRNEKVKVLQSIQPPRPEDVARSVVRAQYLAGKLDGKSVRGYREEDRVDPQSRTEAYVALRLFVENWRWAGVPIYLRTGKRMARRVTEIVVQFKTPPLQLFETVECVGDVCDLTGAKPNQFIFRIQPDEGIALEFSAKRPVMQVQVESVAMDFSYSETWRQELPEAYERLLLDVMRGDSTLFTRSDEVETAWGILDPILKTWEADDSIPLCAYAPGSWGPREADALLQGGDDAWRNR